MPIDLKLNQRTHDLQFTPSGDLQFIRNMPQEAQSVSIHLKTFRGEWAFDSRIGVDYPGVVTVKGARRELAEAELRRAIRGVPGVQEILSFELVGDPATRAATVRFSARSASGRINGEVPL